MGGGSGGGFGEGWVEGKAGSLEERELMRMPRSGLDVYQIQ